MATPNVQRILWEYLTASGTSLYTLINTRAWHSAYPQEGQWADGTAGIVFTLAGDDTGTNAQTQDITAEFKCHGGDRTYSAAQAVERALFDRLHNAGGRVTSGYIHKAVRTGRQDLEDPDTGWPFTLARYNMSIED